VGARGLPATVLGMRIAVFGDVHGNAFALRRVLDDARAATPDAMVNLGDQVTGRADPARAYALQAALRAQGTVEVIGSAEPHLRAPDELNAWLRSVLPDGAVERLQGLPVTARVADGSVVACHGDPSNPSGHLLWSWQRGPYVTRSCEDLRAAVRGLDARVVLCGHTHREGMTVVDDTLVVNVGAVGVQVDGDPRARWALLEFRAGRWLVEFRRVTYDWNAAAAWVSAHAPDGQRPDGLAEATALTTGR